MKACGCCSRVEVDRAAWFELAEARSKIHKGQVALLDEMNSKLGG